MRTIEGSLLAEDKTLENVSHYISPHHSASEDMAVNGGAIHSNSFASQTLCRQVNVSEDGQLCGWSTDLLVGSVDGSGGEGEGTGGTEPPTEDDRRLAAAALVATQFVHQHTRNPLMQELGNIDKIVCGGRTIESSSVLLNNSIRLYHHQNVEGQVELRGAALVEVPHLLPPLPLLKKAQEAEWYHAKANIQYTKTFKAISESDSQLKSEDCEIDMNNTALAHNRQQNRKSLPHKKRISRKLKRNNLNIGNISNNQTANDDVQQTVEILQEAVTDEVLTAPEHHSMTSAQIVDNSVHGERALFICQLCGEFYGDDQMQFFHHLKQHYEPHNTTIIIGNHMGSMQHDNSNMSMDKIAESMVVGNSQLPEALVELSLEGTVPDKSSLYQTQNKIPSYVNADKSLFSTNEKDALFSTDKTLMFQHSQKQHLYASVDKIFSCHHCPKTFRRQKQYDTHIRETHAKIDEMSEFSEPEDLMEGIHVVVEPDNEEYLREDLSSDHSTVLIQTSLGANDQYILPHLTIENGQVHQSHVNVKNWYLKHELEVDQEKNNCQSMMSEGLSGEEVGGESMGEGETVEGEEGEQVECPFCGEIFSNRKQYSEHAQQCHLQLKEEVLQRMIEDVDGEVVDEEIINDNDLVVGENQETESIIESPDENTVVKINSKDLLPCKKCGKEFRHRNSLVYHMLSHEGTRPYPCDICKKRFFSVSALKVHTRLHSGIKPYKCVECGRMFRQWGDLKYHSISIHSNEKQHQCEYCGKDFARKYSLIVHRRIHTGEKNYKCDFCDKKFRASSYLQNHRRIHTGEKPHTCETCGKAFRMKGDMKRHLNTHAKEKQKFSDKDKDKSLETENKVTPATPKRLKVKNGSSSEKLAQTKEMKIEKQEVDRENSNGEVKDQTISIDEMISSPSNEAVLQDETRLGSNFPLENNGQMYGWPVFIA